MKKMKSKRPTHDQAQLVPPLPPYQCYMLMYSHNRQFLAYLAELRERISFTHGSPRKTTVTFFSFLFHQHFSFLIMIILRPARFIKEPLAGLHHAPCTIGAANKVLTGGAVEAPSLPRMCTQLGKKSNIGGSFGSFEWGPSGTMQIVLFWYRAAFLISCHRLGGLVIGRGAEFPPS